MHKKGLDAVKGLVNAATFTTPTLVVSTGDRDTGIAGLQLGCSCSLTINPSGESGLKLSTTSRVNPRRQMPYKRPCDVGS